MKVPIHFLVASQTSPYIVATFGQYIQVVSIVDGQILSSTQGADTKDGHIGFIRLLATHYDGEKERLISTGEDKTLKVWSLPELKLENTRILPRRANVLKITPDGQDIAVCDKFGDVYSFPLHAPSPVTSNSNETKPPIYTPVLGHVSMLTSCTFTADGEQIITADRDEHIRISGWGKRKEGWRVDGFLLGHRRFVSAVTLLLPSTSTPSVLLSGGGDPELLVWDLESQKLLSKLDVSVFGEKCRVNLQKGRNSGWDPNWRAKGKNKSKGGKVIAGGKETPEETTDPSVTAEKVSVELDHPEAEETQDGEGAGPVEVDVDQMNTEKAKIAVKEILRVQTEEGEMIVVTSAGSSAILSFAASRVMHAPAPIPEIVDLGFPILSTTTRGQGADHQIWVALDVTHSTPPIADSDELKSCRCLHFIGGKLTDVVPDPQVLVSMNSNCSVESDASNPIPDVNTLYTELDLLSKDPKEASEESRAAASSREAGALTSDGGDVPEGSEQTSKKRSHQNRTGKRAKAKLEYEAKVEAAKAKNAERGT